VRGWTPIASGESGARVYRRGERIAKVGGDLDGERRRIAWLGAAGVPCPEVLDFDGSRLVMSAVPGVPASAADVEAAWPSILGVLGRIHALPVASCPFERRLATMFALAEAVVASDRVEPAFLSDEQRRVPPPRLLDGLRAELETRLAQEPADLVVCHGDPCLPNFMVDGDTCTGVIDLGRVGIADRHADLALLAADSGRPVAGDPERLRFYLALDPLTWRRSR
jgi:streptomycin 3"-kinase